MTESTQDFVTDFPLLKQIVNLAQEKKAVQLVAMDVRGLSSITDYFVICSGDSEPQVKAIADNIRKGTPKKPNHLEGYENLNWVLMDYFDVVVHVFGKDDRGYYNIEKLWADAPITEFTDEAPETTDF
ncbi:MAG: ribosome silencing factor [Candidatus Marinimicrobia bacterium]|jgi:ribosome-associated protein|nr:ribosome silencing factor [Candidatus Neomarinimicrobiota bacterium]MBT4555665.1 ribosome silencing factor [Candidatus Neomarinimicrobiota bacterium]MBT4752135.1 ribosome silencing factor [Candidatus Neomarinimicrobiota bacterium]MBT5116081.1 ribosome silencing factor [Candidatus Neomarinimicrobiota bacterium]MBT5748472.1 ribosome silencing factor [Candidatus Neomarinimicrobiota bacterium]|tara:strand:- start:5198 stop:5581 length:384 start_codon:yes stop_codon:yes gene_type:complete